MSVRSRGIAAALACTAALAALGGCGGGDDELTAAAFARQVNAMCREVLSAHGAPATGRERLERLDARLDAIEAPSDLRDDYDAFRDALHQAQELAPNGGAQERLSDADQAALVVRLGKLMTASRALRLNDCA